jgi:hypothetical protein
MLKALTLHARKVSWRQRNTSNIDSGDRVTDGETERGITPAETPVRHREGYGLQHQGSERT